MKAEYDFKCILCGKERTTLADSGEVPYIKCCGIKMRLCAILLLPEKNSRKLLHKTEMQGIIKP